MFSYNFAFLRDINRPIYEECCDYGKYIYTDPYKASDGVRHILGLIAEDVVSKEKNKDALAAQFRVWKEKNVDRRGIEFIKDITDVKDLSDKYEIIRVANSEMKKERGKGIVPGTFFGKISLYGNPDINKEFVTHRKWKDPFVIDFLRSFGNNGPHPEATDIPVLATVNNAALSYKVLHEFLKSYYKKSISKKGMEEPTFDETKIPIVDYFADSEYVPLDSEWSKCVKEYSCHYYTGNNDLTKHYAILRKYRGEDYAQDNLFITRNVDIYGNIRSTNSANTVDVKEIKSNTDDENGAYYIAYEFTQKPYRLNNATFKQFPFSIKDRMEICAKIVNDVYKLHTAKPPIFHRDLSYDSIALCNFSGEKSEWVPYIIKFNFAKYKDGQVGTVVEDLIAADYKMYEDEKAPARLNKYRIDVIDKDTEWDKVDIYSLGNLLVDILLLNIHPKKIGGKQFDDISEMLFIKSDSPTIIMLKRMLSEDIYERPDIREVKTAFDSEAKRWI